MAAETVDRETGELVGAEETLEFPQVRVDKKFVINQQGRDHVLFSGLIDALHQLSAGFFSVDTRIEQLPTAENGHQAVCSALVRVFDPDNPDVVRRSASGIGDASPANVNRMMANALIRMAETRSKARALRDLLNVGMVAYEELGPQGPEPASDRIAVGDRVFSREEVVGAYKKRLAQAKEAGLALGQGDLDEDTAPLSLLVGRSQELKRRLEAKAGGGGK